MCYFLLLLLSLKAVCFDLTYTHFLIITIKIVINFTNDYRYHYLSNSILNSFIGWLYSVAVSSYFHIFIVLSHSPLIMRVPLLSKDKQKMPFYAAIDPG